jgi:hypothetical protein
MPISFLGAELSSNHSGSQKSLASDDSASAVSYVLGQELATEGSVSCLL